MNWNPAPDRLQVWSSGGGTQSTAIAVLILQGRLPVPDFAFIADTTMETQETWDYLDQVVNPAMTAVGLQVERLAPDKPRNVLYHNGKLLIPAFLKASANGPDSKLLNFCSAKWKRDFVKSVAVQRGIVPAVNWLGMSAEEPHRIRGPRAQNWLIYYPLAHEFRITRNGCVKLIQEFGWPPAPKSSCFLCPNRKNSQWRHLRDTRPDEYFKAIRADLKLRETHPDAYLHPSLRPLGEVDLDVEAADSDGQLALCDSGECFV